MIRLINLPDGSFKCVSDPYSGYSHLDPKYHGAKLTFKEAGIKPKQVKPMTINWFKEYEKLDPYVYRSEYGYHLMFGNLTLEASGYIFSTRSICINVFSSAFGGYTPYWTDGQIRYHKQPVTFETIHEALCFYMEKLYNEQNAPKGMKIIELPIGDKELLIPLIKNWLDAKVFELKLKG